MSHRLNFIMLMSVFLWLGFIGAISFMESWLKFQAPGVTLSIGLGIGKIVFGALNKIELLLSGIVLVCFLLSKDYSGKFWYIGILVILLLQTFWILPVLDARADIVISGQKPPASALHWLFVLAELVKSVFLVILGYTFFQTTVSANRSHS